MKITIITATFNSQRYLSQCLQSVADQDYANIEHIVVDGGSTDGTKEIIKTFSTVSKYISERDMGIYDALNKGINLASGDVIGFVHSDDMLASNDIVSKIASIFEKDHNLSLPPLEYASSKRRRNEEVVDGVYGNLEFVDPEDTKKVVRTWISAPFDRKQVRHGWMPPHPTLFLRREVYEKYGLFDISFKIAGDYDFMLRLMLDYFIELSYLPEILIKMRKGGVSTGNVKLLYIKSKEDIRALRNNGFRLPLTVLVAKNLRKVSQLFLR